MVKNEPKYKIGVLQKIRGQLEHRAFWLYLLCKEAKKKGLEWEEFAPAAITECGLTQGKNLVEKGGTDSLKGLLNNSGFNSPISLSYIYGYPEPFHLAAFLSFSLLCLPNA